jgi:hypothetical protein
MRKTLGKKAKNGQVLTSARLRSNPRNLQTLTTVSAGCYNRFGEAKPKAEVGEMIQKKHRSTRQRSGGRHARRRLALDAAALWLREPARAEHLGQ